MATRYQFRLSEPHGETVLDGQFVCETRQDMERLVRRLQILRELLPRRGTTTPVIQGGQDALAALVGPA